MMLDLGVPIVSSETGTTGAPGFEVANGDPATVKPVRTVSLCRAGAGFRSP